jgi:hypothetical protein
MDSTRPSRTTVRFVNNADISQKNKKIPQQTWVMIIAIGRTDIL